jgi:hypothetical protein
VDRLRRSRYRSALRGCGHRPAGHRHRDHRWSNLHSGDPCRAPRCTTTQPLRAEQATKGLIRMTPRKDGAIMSASSEARSRRTASRQDGLLCAAVVLTSFIPGSGNQAHLPKPPIPMKILIFPIVAALAGCSSAPMCGSPEAVGAPVCSGWMSPPPPQRDYVANPIYTPSPIQTAPSAWGAQSGEQYQLIMVNTPNGLVQKRCKVLNGQVVACF